VASAPSLCDDVRRLITEALPSVERLEILLLLYDGRQRGWTIEELQAQIRSTPESVQLNVSALVAASLASAESTFPTQIRYRASGNPWHGTVEALAQLYRMRRVSVIEAIYADRHGEAKSFSDAFKFRKPHDR